MPDHPALARSLASSPSDLSTDALVIYLSPEEELTSVRERLERTPAHRIILAVPSQTKLQSHVGWRLIHARMRELGKDLLVISPDRKVRAIAKGTGIPVAERIRT